jgi:hypothetical protein
MLRFFMGIAGLSTAKRYSGSARGCSLGCGFGDTGIEGPIRRRAQGTPLAKYMAADGNRLPDLVAAVAELRQSDRSGNK